MTVPELPALTATTVEAADVHQLIPLLEQGSPLLWMRRGNGLAGVGELLRLEFHGANRFAEAASTWRSLVAAATVHDPFAQAGTGLVAFGTFAFDESSGQSSVLIVPKLVVGREAGVCWVTRISLPDPAHTSGSARALPPESAEPQPTEIGPNFGLVLTPGAQSPEGFEESVAEAIKRITQREVGKVVVARDLVGTLPEGADLRRVLENLALGYPDCWTYSVDGMIGSSPETLITANHGAVTARVLAGTMSRGADPESDQAAAVALATSTKDVDEHEFAVQSLLASLRPHTSHVTTSDVPFTMKLPNVWHLATDVEGTLSDSSTSLDLLAAVHPTAAVAGTPTDAALAVIRQLEPFDRGRYAGPVGWVGADGDGEWAIALRGAQVSDTGEVTAYAGCGIVAESVPAHELAETRMKFRPIIEAFAG